jgi:hypothetical protein
LIDVAAKASGPIAVIDRDRIIGVVEHSHLLRGLQGQIQ